jgi:hypothetical protein
VLLLDEEGRVGTKFVVLYNGGCILIGKMMKIVKVIIISIVFKRASFLCLNHTAPVVFLGWIFLYVYWYLFCGVVIVGSSRFHEELLVMMLLLLTSSSSSSSLDEISGASATG